MIHVMVTAQLGMLLVILIRNGGVTKNVYLGKVGPPARAKELEAGICGRAMGRPKNYPKKNNKK